jgi:hypothetical protein
MEYVKFFEKGIHTPYSLNNINHFVRMSITVAVRSKAWTAFARSNAGIGGSNTTEGMDVCVCLFCLCAVLCAGNGLATSWSPVQGVLPTM